jgi:hypothetical protein
MLHARPWLVALILVVLVLLGLARGCPLAAPSAPARLLRRCRRLHPRTPDACPLCRLLRDRPAPASRFPPVPPWREGRGRRGAPRRSPTQGYACRNPRCRYYAITEAQVHALVGDGHQGKTDRSQQLRCQACGTKVSVRWGTGLAQLKTPPARIGEVLGALAEGLPVAAAVRVFGHGEATITRWRDRAAHQAQRLHRHFLHDLHLPHVQLDELRARLRPRERVTWLWLALDPQTKLLPALVLGPRTQERAQRLVHALRAVLAPTCLPLVTTDGLRHDFYALTAHYGHWVAGGRCQRWQVDPSLLHGQVHKR